VISRGTIYVAGDGQVYALDAATGAILWSAQAPAPISLVVLAAGRVLGVGATIAAAFDAGSGAPSWTRPLDDAGEPVGAAATDDALFVTFAKGATRRLALADGQIAWTYMVEGRPSPPLAIQDSVYVGDTANRFHALDAKNGKPRWSWRTGGDVIGAAADPSADPKAVYYASLDAVLRAVNPGNGHQRWKRDVGTRAVAPPLALDGSVVVAGLTPTLSGFAPLTGIPQGTFDLPGELSGSPIVSPTLAPRAVAVAVILKDGRAYGLRALSLMFNESAPPPLTTLPGKTLTRERLP
jgi:outer membrane protein assembly factor BamB